MGKNIKARLPEMLAGVGIVTPEVFAQLSKDSGASEGYLRRLLRESGLPLDPLVEGVRQDNLENLKRTLLAMTDREMVLEAKRHCVMALRRDAANPWRKTVLLHLNTWLENPSIYPTWLRVRERRESPSSDGSGETASPRRVNKSVDPEAP